MSGRWWCGAALGLAVAAGAGGCAAPSGSEPAVPAGINDRWRSESIEPLIRTLEAEDREVYANRQLLAAATGPLPGWTVADVGAGSGFMTELFAGMVGPSGTVYAVDINPALMEHVAGHAREQGLTNVRTIVCSDTSAGLPRDSVDLVFICDTYHHFEHPMSTMRSIHEALRGGGQLVLVEMDRGPGASEFAMRHVRAGREAFTREIESAGFRLTAVCDLPGLEKNYVLRFRRVP